MTLVVRGNRRWGFEVKRTAEPKVTRSMHSALADLKLDRLDVVHAGRHTFPPRRGCVPWPCAGSWRT